jgi:hypothetical protein
MQPGTDGTCRTATASDRMMRMWRLTLVALLAVAVAACGAPMEEDPVTPPDDEAADLEGTLGGDPALEGGCAWLDAEDGRYEVLWPDGYEVAFDPVRLVGPDGETVATEGDLVRVRGEVAEDVMTVCMVGTIFEATEVLQG